MMKAHDEEIQPIKHARKNTCNAAHERKTEATLGAEELDFEDVHVSEEHLSSTWGGTGDYPGYIRSLMKENSMCTSCDGRACLKKWVVTILWILVVACTLFLVISQFFDRFEEPGATNMESVSASFRSGISSGFTDSQLQSRQQDGSIVSQVELNLYHNAFPSFSSIRDAVLEQYGCDGPQEGDIDFAMHVMETVEKDGLPIPINKYPYLFVGSVGPAYNLDALRATGITHIICVSPGSRLNYEDSGIKYLRIHIHDNPNDENRIRPHIKSTNKFIDEAKSVGGKILVHCWNGNTRSVSFVIAYIMWLQGMSADGALKLIRETRPTAEPPTYIWDSLLQYQDDLRGRHHM